MAMNVGSPSASGDPEVMIEINTTPLIDVMLVLLIMLIITIPIQLHAVELNLPQGNPPPPLVEPEVVRINIEGDGSIWWNGEVIDGVNALEPHRSRHPERATRTPHPPRPRFILRHRRRRHGRCPAQWPDQDRAGGGGAVSVVELWLDKSFPGAQPLPEKSSQFLNRLLTKTRRFPEEKRRACYSQQLKPLRTSPRPAQAPTGRLR
jgi:biopolymer transport protein ExbD